MMLSRFPSRPTGFTILEVLVAVFIMATITVAIISLAVLGTRTAGESERHTVALSLVNQQVERIRGLAYDQIGFTLPQPDEPDGVLEQNTVHNQNQQPYAITTTITLVDDPLNGTANPFNEATADYKKIQVTAAWQARGGVARDVTVVTYVAVSAVPSVPPPSPTASPTTTVTPPPTSTPHPPTPPPTPTPSPTPTGLFMPTVDIKANNSDGPVLLTQGASVTLSWTSTNAISCVASNGWNGPKATSGSQSMGSVSSSITYELSCVGIFGNATDTVIVTVFPATPTPSPTPTFSCVPPGMICSTNVQCCSSVCFNGFCS